MREVLAVVALLLLPLTTSSQSINYHPSGSVYGVPASSPSIRYYPPAILRAGLVSFYTLDETANGSSPTSRADSWGGYTLTDSGTYMPSVAGYSNNAARGTNSVADYLESTNAVWGTTFKGASAATISFWHRWNGVGGNSNVGIANNGSCSIQIFFPSTRASDRACYAYTSSSTYTITAANCVPNDTTTWVHLTYVYDGTLATPAVSIYRNGVALGTSVISGPVASSLPVTAGDVSLLLGKACGATYGSVDYDNVAIWNRALTASEVQTLFLRGGRP